MFRLIAVNKEVKIFKTTHLVFSEVNLLNVICFSKALDVGCGRGYLSSKLSTDVVKSLTQCELSSKLLDRALPSAIPKTQSVCVDEEEMEFDPEYFDLGKLTN